MVRYRSMTVTKLREVLRGLGLSETGTKPVLIERLYENERGMYDIGAACQSYNAYEWAAAANTNATCVQINTAEALLTLAQNLKQMLHHICIRSKYSQR